MLCLRRYRDFYVVFVSTDVLVELLVVLRFLVVGFEHRAQLLTTATAAAIAQLAT